MSFTLLNLFHWLADILVPYFRSVLISPLASFQLLELIIGYLHYFMIPMGEPQMLALLDFHKDLVLRFLKAVPQTMRLWGWNQMRGLIALTHGHYWSPKAIRVRVEKTKFELNGFESPNKHFGTQYQSSMQPTDTLHTSTFLTLPNLSKKRRQRALVVVLTRSHSRLKPADYFA